MKKAGKLLGRIALGAVIVAILVGGLGTYTLKYHIPNNVAPRSFPEIEGEIQVEGLEGPVEIYRDEMGIPHIYASSLNDLFFAQGYVHAQDRFWQMDFWRHIGSGRLSEMFGESQVETDIFLRTLGWRQVAEQEYGQLNEDSKAILDAYALGVNAYIAEREPIELSLEYLILTGLLNSEYQIEPWTPVHSLTWGKAMAWDLRSNIDEEVERAILLKILPQEQVDALYPPYPQDYPVIVPQIGEAARNENPSAGYPPAPIRFDTPSLEPLSGLLAQLDSVLGPGGSGIGSNSWAVSGDLTSSGAPLLANDMHLGIQMPSIWYQNALHCQPKSDACPFETTGFTFPSVPGVVAGHNDRIAWAYTNLGPDVQDLFIEKVNPENPDQYEADGEWLEFETREEVIRVAGGDPVELTVRITRHGPIISDVYGPLKDQVNPDDPDDQAFKDQAGIELPETYAIALSWTALTPSTPFEAIWGFNRAQNWEQFRQAARGFHVPAQNLLYADVDGNIGYQTPGQIPIRKAGDGRYPVPGWTGEFDWNGFIPFDELPHAFNPESGYIVTANNQAHPRDYPYLISRDWNYGQRAERIVTMIENTAGTLDISDFQSMHGDSRNLNAETLIPVLLQIDFQSTTSNQEIAMDRLSNWDYQNRADSQSAAVFEWFWWNLLMRTFKDDLPEEYWPGGQSRWVEVMRRLVNQPDSAWWDDQGTTGVEETRDDLFVLAFQETVAQLEKDHGKDPAEWPTWGELHTATFRNATLGESGIGPIEALFNRGPFETGGGENLVNATGWSVGDSFEVDWLPSEREIVDLGDMNNSLALHTTGQSGHAYHPHYIDMAPMWAEVQYYPMWWDKHSVQEDSEGLLRLVP